MSRKVIYQEDLAYIHHTGFGKFAEKSARGILQILLQAGLRRGTLVDLACGSGLWARAAQRAGFDVIGVDQSPAMIRLARNVASAARFHCGSLHEFHLPACDAVTIVGEGLNYVSSPNQRTGQLHRLFQRVFKVLRPGGVLLFDIIMHKGSPLDARHWRSGKDWAVLTDVKERSTRQLLIRQIVTFRKIRSNWRRGEETHQIRLFGPAEVRKALHDAGFSTRTTRHYGRMAVLPRRLVFIARKPA